jgi:hypothetical protein
MKRAEGQEVGAFPGARLEFSGKAWYNGKSVLREQARGGERKGRCMII